LRGEQHTEHIATGQQLSQHSLPTLPYFLFPPTYIFFNSILASRTFGTFTFAPTHEAYASAKVKEPNLLTQRMTFVPRTNIFLLILTSYNSIIA